MKPDRPDIPESAQPVERELRYAIAAYKRRQEQAALDAKMAAVRQAQVLFDAIRRAADEYDMVIRIAEDAQAAGLPLPGIRFLYELAGSYPLDVGRILFARLNGTLRVVMPFGPHGRTRIVAGQGEVLYANYDNTPAELEKEAMELFLKTWPQFKKQFLSAVRKACQEN